MQMKTITSISLKIVGLYCLIQAILIIRPLVHSLGLPKDQLSVKMTLIIGSIVPFVLLIGLGLYLLVLSNNLAEKMVLGESTIDISKGIDTKEIQALAFSVVGIVLIAVTIPKLFYMGVKVSMLQMSGLNQETYENISRENIANAVGILIQFIIGILLFIGGGSLSNIWHAIKKRIQYEKNITSG